MILRLLSLIPGSLIRLRRGGMLRRLSAQFTAVAVLLALPLPVFAAASWWTVRFNESPASGEKSCAVMSAGGLTAILAETADGLRVQHVVVFNLKYRTKAYLAWGGERFASEPAGARDMGAFSRAEAPRIIQLLSARPPAYDWMDDDDDRWAGTSFGVAKFAERYGECLALMGWSAEDDLRLEQAVEPEPIEEVPLSEQSSEEEPR